MKLFKATRFGLVVRGLGSIDEVLGSILIDNIVNQKYILYFKKNYEII
jgi:hypothetical protein